MPFSSYGLPDTLLQLLARHKYLGPYPIQQEVIPAILRQKDVLGIAPTGSGKTAAYVLPILAKVQAKSTLKNRHARVLVLVPTRELAMQVQEVFRQFSPGVSKTVKILAVYGGVSINPQMMALNDVSILIATPGRLLELIEQHAVHLSKIETLVLDEADKMLNLGFKEEIDRIFALLPVIRQNLLFSATLSSDLNNIKQLLLHDPVVFKIEEEAEQIELITQTGYFVSNEKKGPLLRYLIKRDNMQQVLVFTSTIYSADNVADKLRKNGIDALSIHSRKSQGARTDALTEFKAGTLRVLVATDLISRGIDIRQLPHVFNYELPRSPKEFIHRIGRTGRAESPGEAITFVTDADRAHFKVIQKKMGKHITMIDSENIDLKVLHNKQ